MKRYVITFRDASTAPSQMAASLRMSPERIFDAEDVLGTDAPVAPEIALFFDGIGALAIGLTRTQAAELATRREIVEVISDAGMRALNATRAEGVSHEISDAERRALPWNIEMVRAERAWRYATGGGVRVAVLDSGIDDSLPDLPVAGGVSFVSGVSSWRDDLGHGTHCAGIIGARNHADGATGVAPGCELHSVKVLARDGLCSLASILSGMGWAARQRMDVVSISIGAPATGPDGCFIACQRAVDRCLRAGTVVIAAAGNFGATQTPWVGHPARCPGAMAVAAVDRSGNLTRFSCGRVRTGSGTDVEIAAPGVRVRSSAPGGGERFMSGTSMACSHLAGAAALLKERRPDWNPEQIQRHLRRTARAVDGCEDPAHPGYHVVDCQRAVLAERSPEGD